MYHYQGRNVVINAVGKRILFIPDTHAPYHHKDTRKFLTYLKKIFKPDIVIHLGDEVDNHGISFHDSVAELFSPGHELEQAIDGLQTDIHSIFPEVHLLDSNHGSLVYRKLKHHQIPISVLRPLPELYSTPKWRWHKEIILKTKMGNVYVCHGKSAIPGKLALAVGASSVQGHFHGKFRIEYFKFANGRMIFDMIGGCLVDPKSEAFAYAVNHIPKPILGACVIHESGIPELIPLEAQW